MLLRMRSVDERTAHSIAIAAWRKQFLDGQPLGGRGLHASAQLPIPDDESRMHEDLQLRHSEKVVSTRKAGSRRFTAGASGS